MAPRKTKRRESILWIEAFGFLLIIALGWAAEFLHMPHVIFSGPNDFNWARPVLKTVIVLFVWGAVHAATRQLLKRLHHLEEYLLVCAWCRKIGHEGEWMTMEHYFGSAFATQTTHGICPECSRKVREADSSDAPVARSANPER
ncbi:MAG TPA: hypothetical protein VHD62_09875 [Opitutaceae bacterium]|nr:hypothetical protein [Opitutaceae bacterium]